MSSDPAYSGDWWRDLRDDLDARCVAAKESQAAILHLAAIYGGIPVPERGEVDQVLWEWILSDDPSLRYDALYIVNEYTIRSVEPALRTLQQRLEAAGEPASTYEWAKVNRILGRLAASD